MIMDRISSIDRQSPVPLYHQLKEILLELIEGGEFAPNTSIPTEKELEEQYRVSRTTVRQAITELVNDGYLYRQQGVGTFVSRPKIGHNAQELLSFSDEMRRRRLKPGTQLLHFNRIVPSKKVARQLGLLAGEEVYEIQRLRFVDSEPVGLHTSYLPVRNVPDLTYRKLEEYQSLYQLLQDEYEINIVEADETLEASLAHEDEAELLRIAKGSPVLLVERVSHSGQSEPIEFVKMVYRADRYKYHSRLRRRP
jgi:GntR family transcriptional regulator